MAGFVVNVGLTAKDWNLIKSDGAKRNKIEITGK